MKSQVFSDLRTATEIKPEYDTSKKKRMGIIGGTFNPPHVGHLMIADQVCHQLGLEKVFFLPSSEAPHKEDRPSFDDLHRVRMIEKAIADNPCFDIELCEIERGGKSYSYDTMLYLTNEHPDVDYYFIIGGDMVDYLPKWYKINELIQLVNFVGVNRPGHLSESDFPIIWVDVPNLEISSTALRKKMETNCPVRYLIPDKTLDYIQEKGLYQNGKQTN